MKRGSKYSEMRDYLRVVRRQWLLVVLVMLLFGGAALAYSLAQDKVYEAEASLVFQDPATDVGVAGSTLPSAQTPELRASEGATTLSEPDVKAAVRRRVGSLAGTDLSARPEARTSYVVVQVQASSPKRAKQVVQAYVAVIASTQRRAFRQTLDKQLATVRKTSRRVNPTLDPPSRARRIADENALKALRRLGRPVRVVKQASVSATPVSPKPGRNTLLGLAVGLVLGLAAAFSRASFDRVLRTSEDIAEAAKLPVLARVRDVTFKKFSLPAAFSGSKDAELGLEAARILRTSLDFLDAARPAGTVLVSSPSTGEGKSTVAMSLAAASALTGRRTLLVECDLRRPVFAKRIGLSPAPGLSDLIEGRVPAAEAQYDIPLGSNDRERGGVGGSGSLTCITAGSTVTRPAELLASKSFADQIGILSRAYEFTVIDSAPLLPVGDSLALVPLVDRLVLCVRARQTRRDEIKAAREVLDRLPPCPAGVVVTGVRRGEEMDYGYYSPYGYAAGEMAASSS